MSDRGETRQQPSIPDPCALRAEHAGLGVTIAAFTAGVVALVVEYTTPLVPLRGGYSLLAGLMVVGVVCYFGVRVLRELSTLKAQRIEVRQMLRHREMMQRRAVGEPVSTGGHRLSRGGDRSEYWDVYTDVLEDLGGIEHPPSEN